MKFIKSSLFLLMFFAIFSIYSCKKGCEELGCQNGGTCDGDVCINCAPGYIGDFCETLNVDLGVQALLELDFSPDLLLANGFEAEDFYGIMYKGGLIFYLDPNEGTGFVAATEDQSSEIGWGCEGIDLEGLDNVAWNNGVPEGPGTEVGEGKRNTDEILSAMCLDSSNGSEIAAKLCRDYRGGDYEDWFLPSIKELDLMYTNIRGYENIGGFTNYWYWSSTEGFDSYAWGQFFIGGGQSSGNKSFEFHVRAVRTFDY